MRKDINGKKLLLVALGNLLSIPLYAEIMVFEARIQWSRPTWWVLHGEKIDFMIGAILGLLSIYVWWRNKQFAIFLQIMLSGLALFCTFFWTYILYGFVRIYDSKPSLPTVHDLAEAWWLVILVFAIFGAPAILLITSIESLFTKKQTKGEAEQLVQPDASSGSRWRSSPAVRRLTRAFACTYDPTNHHPHIADNLWLLILSFRYYAR